MAVKQQAEVTVTDYSDADHFTTWYRLTTSPSLPSAPTWATDAAAIAGEASSASVGWCRTQPAFSTSSGTPYLYECLQTVWGDGTCDWGDVQLSTSFEAAKAAWNAANAAQSAVDNIEIGGRNLALNSKGVHSRTKSADSAQMVIRQSLSDYGKEVCISGVTVLCSFDARVSSGTHIVKPYLTNSSYDTQHATTEACNATTEWQRFTMQITLTGSIANWQVTASSDTGTNGLTYDVRNFKVELGNKPTDWTPAPEDMAEATDSVEYIVGTQSASTGSWTGVTKDAALYTGKTIAYRLPYAGSGSASLNLTLAGGGTTGAKAVYSMTTRVTTHYPANSVIQMTYDGTYWRTTGWYNTNNYDRRRHNNQVKAAANLAKYSICGGTDAGYKTLAASIAFDLAYPILYLNADNASGQTYAIASGGNSTEVYEAFPGIDPANTATVQGMGVNKMVYLKGTVDGTTFTCADANFLTCDISSDVDGYFYIPLGIVANDATTKMYFATSDKLYAYLGGAFQRVDLSATTRVTNTEARLDIAENSISSTVENVTTIQAAVADMDVTLTEQIVENSTNITQTAESIEALVTGLGQSSYFTQTDDAFAFAIDAAIAEAAKTATNFLTMTSEGVTLANSDSDIRQVMSNARNVFKTDAGDIAWFGQNEDGIWEMHISTTYAEDMIRFGDYAWIKRQNGNMTIKWLGEVS